MILAYSFARAFDALKELCREFQAHISLSVQLLNIHIHQRFTNLSLGICACMCMYKRLSHKRINKINRKKTRKEKKNSATFFKYQLVDSKFM